MEAITLHLEKEPRGSGGVRYAGQVPGEEKAWTVYIPQSMATTPEDGVFAKKIQLTVELL